VFLVHHPKWRALEVGEICCDNLTETTLASNLMESQRRYLTRRKTFVSSSRWKKHSTVNHEIKHKGLHIEVQPSAQGFQLQVNGKRGKLFFPSMIEAKMKAFDLFESGALTEYLKRRSTRRRKPPT